MSGAQLILLLVAALVREVLARRQPFGYRDRELTQAEVAEKTILCIVDFCRGCPIAMGAVIIPNLVRLNKGAAITDRIACVVADHDDAQPSSSADGATNAKSEFRDE